jgi:hypothetical protein
MEKTKDIAGTKIVKSCATIGGGLGAAGAAAAASAAATNIAIAAEAASIATWGGGFLASSVAGAGLATSPAWWAVLATNPVTFPIAVAGGTILGTAVGVTFLKKLFR